MESLVQTLNVVPGKTTWIERDIKPSIITKGMSIEIHLMCKTHLFNILKYENRVWLVFRVVVFILFSMAFSCFFCLKGHGQILVKKFLQCLQWLTFL